MSNRSTPTTNELTERRSVEGHDAARVLTLLGAHDSGALTMAALREHGIQAPAQAIYELQLDGYEIDRVPCKSSDRHTTIGYRLRTSAAIPSRSALREVRGDVS
jgi:hypothetical protein